MIDPKELRIGNLVYYKYLRSAPDERVYGEAVISGIHENGFQFKKITGNHSLVMDLKDFDPIPITPEWLERLGFDLDEDDGGRSVQVGNNCSIYHYPDYGFCIHYEFTAPNFHEFNQWHQPTSVHQLQNLFFCLCGEELKIKTQ